MNQAPQKQYRLAIRRPVTMAMLFLTLFVFGLRSYQQLPVNLMPDISYPTLTVRTEYEDAAPEDVEKLVTRPLEELLSIVSGMVELSSVSSAGLSEVVLEFKWDTDMNVAQQDIRDRLDLFDPPRGVVEKPVILRYDPTLDPVMRVAITPEPTTEGASLDPDQEMRALTAIRDAAERHLKSDLEAETGIAQVTLRGGQEEEIQILVDALRLKALGLTLDNVVQDLAQQNINLSGGRLREGKTEYLVRTLNEFESVEDIRTSILSATGGRQLRLSDVAEIVMGTKDRETVVRINGREAVGIEIFKEGGANTVSVCNSVKDLLGFERGLGLIEQVRLAIQMGQDAAAAGKKKPDAAAVGKKKPDAAAAKRRSMLDRLPGNIQQHIISDQSRFINGAVKEVRDATVLGGLLALAVLFLFLRGLKPTLIIGVAIPISVVATFVPMFVRDISLNIMSLGGLALGVGMLVDNSIVVLESVFRCKEEGDGTVDAAERGTHEVGSAVTASTLTTISVFLPLAFVEGIAGQLFGDLALTVTFSLLASLLTALLLIPLIASRKPLALRGDREVIWVLRAYRDGRRSERGVARSLAGILPRGTVYAAQAFLQSLRDLFGPSADSIKRGWRNPGFKTLASAFFSLLALPFLLPIWLGQLALQSAAGLLVALLFLLGLVAMVLIGILGKLLALLLWPPLELFDRGFRAFRAVYGVVLRHALRFSPIVLLLVLALAAHAGWTALRLGRELLPPMRQGEFGVRMEARPGTRIEETVLLARGVEAILMDAPEVDAVTVEVGQEKSEAGANRGENVAEFNVLLKNPSQAARIQDAVIARLRGEVNVFPDVEIAFTLPTLFSFKTAIEVQVVGDETAVLTEAAREAVEKIAHVPGLADVEMSARPGYPEVIIDLDRELLAAKGILPEQVAQRLRTEVQGEIATQFNRAGEKVDIRVRTDRSMLNSLEDLRQLSVGSSATPVPLSGVARIRVEEGPSEIRRVAQRQVVLITANVQGRDLGTVSDGIMAAVADIETPEGCYFLLGGQNRELDTTYQSLRFALLLAIFLVYAVMACQFESFWHPALVMFSVPLAFVGVIYVLDWTGTPISITVFLGGIVLAGIVVNDAIVLVDYINQLRRRGHAKARAIVEAGQVRLRPIIMTTVTTVLGLLPMLLSGGEGAEMRRPMALTVMAGLVAATVLTLLIIPMAYHLFGGRDSAKRVAEKDAGAAAENTA